MAKQNTDYENLTRLIQRSGVQEFAPGRMAPQPHLPSAPNATPRTEGDSLKRVSEKLKDQALMKFFQIEGIQKIIADAGFSDRDIYKILYESRISDENLLFRYHLIHKGEFWVVSNVEQQFRVALFIGAPVGSVSDDRHSLWFWTS